MRSFPALFVLVLLAPAAALPLPVLVEACDAADDAGAGRDATEDDPVALAAGQHAGCLRETDTVDAFLVAPPPGERMAATFDWGGSCFGYVTVWHLLPDGGREVERGLGGTICGPFTVHSDVDRSGPWLVTFELASPSDAGTPYSVLVETGTTPGGSCGAQDDGGSGGDALFWTAAPLGDGRGCVDEHDWDDAYRFTLAEPGKVRLTLEETDPCWVVSGLIHPAGDRDFMNAWWYDAWDCRERSWGFELPAGDYDLVHMPLTMSHPYAVRYDLSVEAVEFGLCGPQDDGASGRDSDEASPVPIAYGQTLRGCMDEFDPLDGFLLDVTAGDAFRVTVTPIDGCHAPWLATDPERDGANMAQRSACGYMLAYRATETASWGLYLWGDGQLDDDMGAYTIEVQRCRGATPLLPAKEACQLGDLVTTTWRDAQAARPSAGLPLVRTLRGP